MFVTCTNQLATTESDDCCSHKTAPVNTALHALKPLHLISNILAAKLDDPAWWCLNIKAQRLNAIADDAGPGRCHFCTTSAGNVYYPQLLYGRCSSTSEGCQWQQAFSATCCNIRIETQPGITVCKSAEQLHCACKAIHKPCTSAC